MITLLAYTFAKNYATILKEVLINYLKEENYNVDDKNVKVEEKTIGNVTIACALKYNNYISDWSFLQFHSIDDMQLEE